MHAFIKQSSISLSTVAQPNLCFAADDDDIGWGRAAVAGENDCDRLIARRRPVPGGRQSPAHRPFCGFWFLVVVYIFCLSFGFRA